MLVTYGRSVFSQGIPISSFNTTNHHITEIFLKIKQLQVSIKKSHVNLLTNRMGLSNWNEHIVLWLQHYMWYVKTGGLIEVCLIINTVELWHFKLVSQKMCLVSQDRFHSIIQWNLCKLNPFGTNFCVWD